ncbi:TGB3 [Garlic virus H]|nr:TGB3 [Garlic virus H]
MPNNIKPTFEQEITQKIDVILRKIVEIESKIDGLTRLFPEEGLSRTLTSIEQRLQELHIKVIPTPNDDHAEPSSSTTTPPSADVPISHSALPVFTAQHPTTRCRSYGNVILGDASLHIPMDVRGRRASTALRLIMKHTLSKDATTVKYELLDDGALLLTEEISTPHKLDQPLGDSLALLHSKRENFIYKIRDSGLC